MHNNNGTEICGFDDNLGGGMIEEQWWIGNDRNSQRYQQMFLECMKKEVGIGGGDIKEEECTLGGGGNLSSGGK